MLKEPIFYSALFFTFVAGMIFQLTAPHDWVFGYLPHPTITATSTEVATKSTGLGDEAVFSFVGSATATTAGQPLTYLFFDEVHVCDAEDRCLTLNGSTSPFLSEATIRLACKTDLTCWSVLEKYAK